nr:Cyclin F-box domain containing protein [Haemonchus contortus]
MDLSLLPEEVLVNVLRQTSPTTVIAAKRLNKKLHRIVERNHLAKPRVDEFNVEMRTFHERTRPIGRLQSKNVGTGTLHRRVVVTMKRKNKRRQVVQEGVEGPSNLTGTQLIGEEMRKVLLYGRLSFDGVTADTEFLNMLTAKWNDLRCTHSLSFTLCRLKITEEQLLSLLKRSSCNSLTLDFCHFEHDIVSDKVGNCCHSTTTNTSCATKIKRIPSQSDECHFTELDIKTTVYDSTLQLRHKHHSAWDLRFDQNSEFGRRCGLGFRPSPAERR